MREKRMKGVSTMNENKKELKTEIGQCIDQLSIIDLYRVRAFTNGLVSVKKEQHMLSKRKV